jgi:diguanylate cyclase (GGDEF)-like protein
MLPAATQSLGEVTAASTLVSYDAWMRDLGNGDTTPPLDVLVALAAADQLTADLTTVIDELVAQERVEQDEARSAQESKRTLMLGVAAIAMILAVAVGVVAARTISRSRRSARDRAELALRDALTGAGSRHELEERTQALTRNPRFDHHLVLMVDLDRFKMVNDAYGHAAGDAVLVEIATRLMQTAAGIEAGRPDAKTSVIRLGGDEFLVTAHGTSAFDIDAIATELDGVRRTSVTYRGERIELAFSFGICHRQGQHELADLMAEADLAAYDDKAARACERAAVDREFDTGRPQEVTGRITARG